jgi:rhodanese-related sulfurtransferase
MIGGWIVLGLLALYAVFRLYRNKISNRGITNASALRRALRNEVRRVTLIDVRTPSEYRSGHIPSAINIPHTKIAKKPPGQSKDSLVIVYCRSGARAKSARSQLIRHGFGRVVNFGGLGKWDGPLVNGTRPGELALN